MPSAFAVVVCFVAVFLLAPAPAAPATTVLILASESMEMPGLSAMVREVVGAIRNSSGGPVNVYAESLDRSRFPGDDQRLLALFRLRYTSPKPDLVVALSGPAIEFVLRYRNEPFLANVPLMYGFVDQWLARSYGSLGSATGVALQSSFLEFCDLALKLHPDARRLVVVSGLAEFDLGWLASFRQVAPQLEARVALRYLTDGTLPEVLGDVATLPDDSLVLYLTLSRDRDGAVYVPRDVLDMIRRVSRVPVYGPSSNYIGRGAVGGPVFDLDAHGKALGRMAARILAGETPSSVKPEVTPARMVFDNRELDRFGIREAQLPVGAEILFRENQWSFHRSWIIAVLVLIAAQTVLIVALFAQRRTRASLRRSLHERLTFGTLLSDVSTALSAVPLRTFHGTVRSVLERVRQYFRVDVVAIFDTSTTPPRCRADSGTTRVSAALEAVGALIASPFGELRLASNQPLTLDSVEDLPEGCDAERQLLLDAGIRSLAMLALEVSGQVQGVLCCIATSRTTRWDAEAQQQLRTVAEGLASALQRQQTAAAVLESDRLKGAILASMAAHITVLDRDGTIIAVNEAWTQFGRANGVSDEASISPGANYLAVCRKAVEDGAPGAREALEGIVAVCEARSNEFQFEYRCDAVDERRWFEMKVRPLRRPEGGAVVTHRETTEDRRHQMALRESEERFRLLADALPVGVWMTDLDGNCIYVNRLWTDWTGRPLERELGDGWLEPLHPADASRVSAVFRKALRGRKAFTTEFRLQRRDGTFRWVLNYGRPRQDAKGEVLGYVGGAIDLTERLEAQERLRELSGRLINAQEEERRRVARDLHDDLQQRLAVLAIELEGVALGRPLGGPEDWATHARRLWTMTSEISSEVHRISHRLLPLKLETLGLLTTIDAYCRETTQQGLAVTFTHSDVPAQLPEDVALSVFRVVQESLRNALKHSGAQEASVALRGGVGGLHLAVSDTGSGFDVSAAGNGDGLGLFSMRQRLQLLGGELRIHSTLGEGTRVEASVPLRQTDGNGPLVVTVRGTAVDAARSGE